MLSGQPDPYNPERTKQAEDKFLSDRDSSSLGQIVNLGQKAIASAVPFGGLVIALANVIGDAIVHMSHGGFDDLPLLSKQRISIYLWTEPGKGYKSQILFSAVSDLEPDRNRMLASEYSAAFAKWLRIYLMQEAYRQQAQRMAKTNDEPMLPVDIVNKLYASGLWPPPIPPMPLTVAQWAKIYPKYSQWYYYTPPRIDPDMQALAETVYQQLVRDFEDDAMKYQSAIGVVLMSADVRALAESNDMMPPFGSTANPIPAPSLRKGVL